MFCKSLIDSYQSLPLSLVESQIMVIVCECLSWDKIIILVIIKALEIYGSVMVCHIVYPSHFVVKCHFFNRNIEYSTTYTWCSNRICRWLRVGIRMDLAVVQLRGRWMTTMATMVNGRFMRWLATVFSAPRSGDGAIGWHFPRDVGRWFFVKEIGRFVASEFYETGYNQRDTTYMEIWNVDKFEIVCLTSK